MSEDRVQRAVRSPLFASIVIMLQGLLSAGVGAWLIAGGDLEFGVALLLLGAIFSLLALGSLPD